MAHLVAVVKAYLMVESMVDWRVVTRADCSAAKSDYYLVGCSVAQTAETSAETKAHLKAAMMGALLVVYLVACLVGLWVDYSAEKMVN